MILKQQNYNFCYRIDFGIIQTVDVENRVYLLDYLEIC